MNDSVGVGVVDGEPGQHLNLGDQTSASVHLADQRFARRIPQKEVLVAQRDNYVLVVDIGHLDNASVVVVRIRVVENKVILLIFDVDRGHVAEALQRSPKGFVVHCERDNGDV